MLRVQGVDRFLEGKKERGGYRSRGKSRVKAGCEGGEAEGWKVKGGRTAPSP